MDTTKKGNRKRLVDWMNEHGGTVALAATIIVIAVVIVYLVFIAVVWVNAERTCYGLRYSWVEVSYLGRSYCGIEVNETDYLIPSENAREWMDTKGKELIR